MPDSIFFTLGHWLYILAGIPIFIMTLRHIGFAALVFMGIAKLTAHPGRQAFDDLGVCGAL